MDLVLGTMYFGTRTDEATSFAMLDRYVDAGGRVLDTANCYSFWTSPTGHGGQSEAVIGRWLAANAGLRDELVIATKVGQEPVDGGGVEGLSAAVVGAGGGAQSAERLGVDVIDLYWAHGEDRSVPTRGDGGRVRGAGRGGRGAAARRLQPPRLAGRAGSSARGRPRASSRTPPSS